MMEIRFGEYTLRSWSWDDAPALVRYANNRNIWLNVRDAFPHPYTKADADAWLDLVVGQDRPTSIAIATESEAIGGMGFTLKDDVRRRTAEIGYWLARTPSGEGESPPMPSGLSSTTPSPVLISYVSWRTSSSGIRCLAESWRRRVSPWRGDCGRGPRKTARPLMSSCTGSCGKVKYFPRSSEVLPFEKVETGRRSSPVRFLALLRLMAEISRLAKCPSGAGRRSLLPLFKAET